MSSKVIIDDNARAILLNSIYSGTGYIDNVEETQVEAFAKMQVSKADTIVPENIAEGVEILGQVGTYTGKSSGFDFETTPLTYDEIGEYFSSREDFCDYPFCKITNVNYELEENQFLAVTYLDTEAEIDEIVSENDMSEESGYKRIFIQEENLPVVDWGNEGPGGSYPSPIKEWWEKSTDEGWVPVYDIIVYVVEKIEGYQLYKVVAKKKKSLNALFLTFAENLNSISPQVFNTQLLDSNDEVIETFNFSSDSYFITSTTKYGESYKFVTTINPDYSEEYDVWCVSDDYHDYNLNGVLEKIESFSNKGVKIQVVPKNRIRRLDITESELQASISCDSIKIEGSGLIDYERQLYFYLSYPEVTGKDLVITLTNSFSGDTKKYAADYFYYYDEDEREISEYICNIPDDSILSDGDENTIISLSYSFETPKTAIYEKSGTYRDFDLYLHKYWEYEYPKISVGDSVYEFNDYAVASDEGGYPGNLPSGARVYVNGIEINVDYEGWANFKLTEDIINACLDPQNPTLSVEVQLSDD